jgi:nitroimidazol reductase NimA-like FMN-containing flavoprotein (pyridoxamine 5'-phosphate oxidase superfamily)
MTTDGQKLGELERLSRDECIAALRANRLGRVVTTFGPDHRPLVRPVSYVCDPQSGSILFHSLRGGKLNALIDRRDACFEIDGESDGSMWSVIIRGRVETEERPQEIARLEQLGFSPTLAIPPDGSWVRIRGEVITGVRFRARSAA